MENEAGLDMRPLLLRRLVWDTFPHDYGVIAGVQKQLGLVPDGDGGLDVEHSASDTRINRVAPLASVLRVMSGLSAEVVSHYVLARAESHMGDDQELEVPEGFHNSFVRQNTEVIYDSAHAIICHLMDTGVLVYGEKVRQS